jgi:hypothetical protein
MTQARIDRPITKADPGHKALVLTDFTTILSEGVRDALGARL